MTAPAPGGPRILLVRHGRPAIWRTEARRWVRGSQVREFLEAYRASGIDPTSRPPPELLRRIGRPAAVFTSGVPRSEQSAAALGLHPTTVDPALDEADLPRDLLRSLRLPPAVWLVVLRVLWFAGRSAGAAESAAGARSRARAAAQRLARTARRRGDVVVVGHGIMNALLCRALVRAGWRRTGPYRGGHWSCNELRGGPGGAGASGGAEDPG